MTPLKQIIILLGLSILLGIFRNYLLDVPMDWIKKPRKISELSLNVSSSDQVEFVIPDFLTEPMLIKFQVANYLHVTEKGVFIDAREPEEYETGHIDGALNIPFDYLEDYEYQLDGIDEETILICYCGGGHCDLSIDLADYLMNDRGFFTVMVYDGGWPEWQENLDIIP